MVLARCAFRTNLSREPRLAACRLIAAEKSIAFVFNQCARIDLMANVVLMGKGEVCVHAAQYFLEREHLACVVPVIPEPQWCPSLIQWAARNNIPVVQSGHHNDVSDSIRIDLAMSIFYERIIGTEFLGRCKQIVNLHNSPLPRYRGVRPINWALKNNERSHGVTIHQITPGVDEGAIYGQITYPIYPDVEEVRDVYAKSIQYGKMLFTDVIPKIDTITPYPQEGSCSYYSKSDIGVLGNRDGWTR